MTYHRVCNQSYTTGATSGTRTGYPSLAPELNPVFFCVVRVAQSLFFCVVFGNVLFVLFLFEIVVSVIRFTVLITPLVSVSPFPLHIKQ
jgi:hypothetical protein